MSKQEPKTRRVLLGKVSVDTGQLAVTDPMNLNDDMVDEDPQAAITFPSGIGDGTYPVYATWTDLAEFGERITKVEIDMMPRADDEAA